MPPGPKGCGDIDGFNFPSDLSSAPGESALIGYLQASPYMPLGKASSTGTPFAVVTSSTPFPTTLNVGSSGPLDDLAYYLDSTMATVDAQGTTDGLAVDMETDCYSVDA
jgi:hypothetical protein